jgi:hypothetical protein
MNKIITPVLGVVAVISITANVLQAKRWSDARPLVTVGSQQITRGEYMSALDAVTEGSVMKTLVLRAVVMDAARRHGVLPTADQIAARMAEVEQKQPGLLDDSTQTPAKVAENRANIIAVLALENLRIAGVDAADSDIDTYYAIHEREFAVPKQVKTTLVITSDPVNTATAERLLEAGTSGAQIATQPGMEVAGINSVGFDITALPDDLRRSIQDTVGSMKAGSVRTFQNDRTAITYRVDSAHDAYIPALSDIRESVARQVRLEKAPTAQVELSDLYREEGPRFDVPQYGAYFNGIASSGNVATASLP